MICLTVASLLCDADVFIVLLAVKEYKDYSSQLMITVEVEVFLLSRFLP